MFVPSNNSKSSFLKSVFAQPDKKIIQDQIITANKNIIKVAVELDTNVGTAILPANIRKKINIQLANISTHDSATYYEKLPLDKVSEALKANGVEMLDEDNTPLKFVMLTGREGRATFNVSFQGKPVSNSMVVVSWHKMEPSGRYEFLVYLS